MQTILSLSDHSEKHQSDSLLHPLSKRSQPLGLFQYFGTQYNIQLILPSTYPISSQLLATLIVPRFHYMTENHAEQFTHPCNTESCVSHHDYSRISVHN